MSETDTKEPETTPKKPQMKIDLTTPEGQDIIRSLMNSIQGIDPRTRQVLLDFMDFGSIVERTTLSTRKDVQRVAYFRYVGRTLFPNNDKDPFTVASEVISEASMAKGGEKAKQVVELFRNTPDLSPLQQSITDTQPQTWQKKIFGGGNKE